MLTVYGDIRSGNCLKVKWLLDRLGRDYRWVETDVMSGVTRSADFLARNPAGQVPAVVLEDGVRRLAIAGDAWHSPAQIERPDWGHRADGDPQAAAASRTALARWAHESGAIVAAGHFPEPQGFGTIKATPAGGLCWTPLD